MLGACACPRAAGARESDLDPWFGGEGYLKWYERAIAATGHELPELNAHKLSNLLAGRCGKEFPKSVCPHIKAATGLFLTFSLFDRTWEWERFTNAAFLRRKPEILERLKNKLLYLYLIEGWRPKSSTDILEELSVCSPEELEESELRELKGLLRSTASLAQRPTKCNFLLTCPGDAIDFGLVEDRVSALLLSYFASELFDDQIVMMPYYIYKDGTYELRAALLTGRPLTSDSRRLRRKMKRLLEEVTKEIDLLEEEFTSFRNPDGASMIFGCVKKESDVDEWIRCDLLAFACERAL